MSVYTRQAGVEDVELLAPMFDNYRRYYRQAGDVDLARRFLHARLTRSESVIFVAQDAAQAGLGFVQLYPSFSSVKAQRVWILNDLFVQPEARRMGVARALMEAARRLARNTGARGLVLETEADNRNAQRLYESLGYVDQNPGYRHYCLDFSGEPAQDDN